MKNGTCNANTALLTTRQLTTTITLTSYQVRYSQAAFLGQHLLEYSLSDHRSLLVFAINKLSRKVPFRMSTRWLTTLIDSRSCDSFHCVSSIPAIEM